MTQYEKGARFERRIKKHFEALGWICFRSAGSHSPADLICIRKGETLLIQCQTEKYFPPAKKAQLIELANENVCQYCFAWRNGKKIELSGG